MADLDKLANSTASTAISRITIVILPFLITIIAYFVTGKLDDIKETQGKFWTVTAAINQSLNDIKTSAATSNEAFIAHKAADAIFEQFVKESEADHEARLRLIEQNKGRP